MKKQVADIVKGWSLGADKRGHAMVLKVDLGHITKSFLFNSTLARLLFVEAPVLQRDFLVFTRPPLVADDWDGAITPVCTHLKVSEYTNGFILFPTLNGEEDDGLLFSPEAWSQFMKELWSYQPHIRSADDASGLSH